MPMVRRSRALALVLLASLPSWPMAAHAQQPLIDAGQQAMIQHYNVLIEQQSTPDQEDEVDRVRRARGADEPSPDERCDRDAVRARLRPEYDRRMQTEGAAAANAWLRQEGEEAGRYAAENC